MRRSCRAAVALVTAAAFVLVGCSQRAVLVPATDLGSRTEWQGLYRVTTKTDKYTTRHFSVSDSMLVISEFGARDKHYTLIEVPLSIPLDEVKSVERLEGHDPDTFIGVTALVVVGLFVITAVVYILLWR